MHLRRNEDLLFVETASFLVVQLALGLQTVRKTKARHADFVVLHLFQTVGQSEHIGHLVWLFHALLLKEYLTLLLVL